MLVVQADVVGEPVERAVVGKGLRDRNLILGVALCRGDGFVYVVLCDEVGCERVQAAGEERREKQI